MNNKYTIDEFYSFLKLIPNITVTFGVFKEISKSELPRLSIEVSSKSKDIYIDNSASIKKTDLQLKLYTKRYDINVKNVEYYLDNANIDYSMTTSFTDDNDIVNSIYSLTIYEYLNG